MFSQQKKERLSMKAFCYGLKALLISQLQLKIYCDERRAQASWDKIRSNIRNKRATVLMLNHTSRLDGLLTAMIAPADVIKRSKSYVSSFVFEIPIFGGIVSRIGHRPVHFKSDADGFFSVDKDKQMKEFVKMSSFLKHNHGILVYCPEGAINKNPKQLLAFRRGSFKHASSLKAEMWSLTFLNNNLAWPRKTALGGLPAPIFYSLRLLTESAHGSPKQLAASSQ
uniref:Phospholipid/glycerol acyltransferase domain-containing protein n=1 Tax=Lotharella oceanica TaxID=641309 RepID=A0A7S2TYK1_9EUKA|mmetsp:Transcript_33349/g.62001  ORF Transcript_33349/g.62001 Transcript_33349/m.62001 type:complete len:225 (+) Transcript_33349:137-811(+)|eukprot:CAMPEP_0170169902 /NCGR_PEP_ID=MMETSP0040_2-20121228/2849_1 /TAXON_ID=641309 /ORGANISM="Lotharella oceanica, Strain CCMP622" /LENGTH=224 /DNA_ID=CAMNT_0010408927 /DNA_START=79 /DNA_END=753 /DNA_ORIENTATION=-